MIKTSEIETALRSRNPQKLLEIAWKVMFETSNLMELRDENKFYLLDAISGQLIRYAELIEKNSKCFPELNDLSDNDVKSLVKEMRDLAGDIAKEVNVFEKAVNRKYPRTVVDDTIANTRISWIGPEKKRSA